MNQKRIRNIVIILLAAILLIAVVALLSRFYTKDNDISPFFSSKKVTTTERPPGNVEKYDVRTPVLRDELTGTPSGKIQPPTDRTESMTPARNDVPLKK